MEKLAEKEERSGRCTLRSLGFFDLRHTLLLHFQSLEISRPVPPHLPVKKKTWDWVGDSSFRCSVMITFCVVLRVLSWECVCKT